MRKLILFLAVVLITTLQIKGQPVSSMPTFTGNTSGAYMPIIIPVSSTFSNRKYPMDSLAYLKTIRDTSAVLRALIGSGGGSYTASNGLTLSSSDFQLGGTIGSDRTINTSTFNVGFNQASNNYTQIYGGKITFKKPLQNTITDNYLEVLPLTSAASQLKWSEFRHWFSNGGGLDSNEVVFKGYNINKGGGAEVGGAPVWGEAWESNYRIPGRILEHYVIHQNSAGQYSRPTFYYMPEDKNQGTISNQTSQFNLNSPTEFNELWFSFARNYNATAGRYLPASVMLTNETGLRMEAMDDNINMAIGSQTANYGDLRIRDWKAVRFSDRVYLSDTLTIASNAGVGKVLTSDASGNATWQTASGGGSGTVTATDGGAGYIPYFTNTAGTNLKKATALYYDTANARFGINVAPLAKFHIAGTGGTAQGITLESTNAGSYGAINFQTPSGLSGQFLSSGSTFNSGAFKPNYLILAQYLNSAGISIVSGGTNSDIEFVTGGYGTSDEKMRIGANGAVGIGTLGNAVASSILELKSTTQGFLPPRMTATQASALSSPAEGLMIYVTNTNGTFTAKGWWGYNGAAWEKLNN